MRILLTGCAGFIGSRIASLLLDSGYEVYGTDNLGSSRYSRLQIWRLDSLLENPCFGFYQADISNWQELHNVFERLSKFHPLSAVVNLGAMAGVRHSVEDPRAYYEVNVLGTLNLLELCREFGVGRFILASTSSVYGAEIGGPVGEENDTSRPLSPYAASKKAAEPTAAITRQDGRRMIRRISPRTDWSGQSGHQPAGFVWSANRRVRLL